MIKSTVVLLFAVSIFYGAYAELLKLNPLCTLSDDIEKVVHDSNNRSLSIQYKADRRCSEPFIIVRLSGASLYKLDYYGFSNNTQSFGYPPLIDAGMYFIELTVIFCHPYQSNSAVGQCVENMYFGRNTLCLPYSFDVRQEYVERASESQLRRPRWVGDKSLPAMVLPTRHQMLASEPRERGTCEHRYRKHHCAPEMVEIAQHLSYNWTDSPPWMEQALQVFTNSSNDALEGSAINICFVGDSHSRKLFWGALALRNSTGPPWLRYSYINCLFAPLFNATLLDEYSCSVAVLSFVIWPMTNSNIPHTERVHEEEMDGLLKHIKQHQGRTQVFMRSENIMGLGDYAISCSKRVRSNPGGMEMANRVTRAVSESHKVPFIDLDPIIYPMWDSAVDFNHPPQKVFIAEVAYSLHKIFSYLALRRLPVQTFQRSVLKTKEPDSVKPLNPNAQVSAINAKYKGRADEFK